MSVEETADRVEAELRVLGSPERAEQEKRYLKSELTHLGVPVPAIRAIAVRAVRGFGRPQTLALAAELWPTGVHELRVVAIEGLVRNVALLVPDDLPVVERMLRESRTWAYVDTLAVKVAGPLADGAVLDRWAKDPDFWIRRSALLALLPGVRSGTPDLRRLTGYGDAMLREKEFFVRKALGWVLRELGKRDPAWVTAWLDARIGDVSGVTFREAVRHLPPADAARLTVAYKARP